MEQLRNPIDAAARLQRVFQAAGIDSMVVGGLAVAVWGEPRATRDADLKVQLTRDDASRLLECLPPHLYELSPDSSELLRRFGFLFIKDTGGVRIDLLLTDTAFDVEAIARRRKVEPLGSEAFDVCAPEDLIIYKMISTRARDHADVPGVIRRQQLSLDHDYVERWLSIFEQALDDSTLVQSYRRMLGVIIEEQGSSSAQ